MNSTIILNLILWSPFIGFIINGIFGSRMSKGLSGTIACLGPLTSFIATVIAYFSFRDTSTIVELFTWFQLTKDIVLGFAFQIDNLALLMSFVVTGVGTLIHVYSIGYMHEDKGFWRFMTYLNLFLFSMLILIFANNLPVLFVGWEGVGLCSFLLIGFWFDNKDYNAAATKAFVMNRIGDLGFLLAMFLIAKEYSTLDFGLLKVKFAEGAINSDINIWITILLFIGVTGKSAQIPLFIWLPDAMAGPTPVSALIHAATMVTAGVYLVARMHYIFDLTPFTQQIIIYVGLATSIVAATIALKQNDIKKVLAYSTVSQLGFMVVALGCGAYITAIFHVMTHAFFKALLFLSAGSVIHGLHGEQDIANMGALKSKMKWTHLVFLIGTLAIVGCPPLAGFFSKDEILAVTFSKNIIVFIGLAISSVMTAWYMFRLYFSTFHGEYRGNQHKWDHAHESPMIMLVPLFILAILSIIGGFFGMPEIFSHHHFVDEFLKPSINVQNTFHVSHTFDYALWAMTIIVLSAIVYFTFRRYTNKSKSAFDEAPKGIMNILSKKYWIDEIYNLIIVNPLSALAQWFNRVFERVGIDDVIQAPGKIFRLSGNGLGFLQSGSISIYILSMVIGLIIFFLMFIKTW